MNRCICMYVCVHECIYICMYVSMLLYCICAEFEHTHICMCVCMYVCVIKKPTFFYLFYGTTRHCKNLAEIFTEYHRPQWRSG